MTKSVYYHKVKSVRDLSSGSDCITDFPKGNPVTCLPTAGEGRSLDATRILASSGLGLLSPHQLWQG